MSVKLLISAVAGAGKTSLTKDLKNSLVISHDGKRYPFAVPHGMIQSFETSDDLIAFVSEKIKAYKAKFGKLPENVVFDSVSRIFETLDTSCNKRFSGFTIFSQLKKEVEAFTDFLEKSILPSGMNVIIISHATYDSETSTYELVSKGSFGKMGGFFSVVDEAIFITTKNDKRVINFRSTKFPARTLQDDLPDSIESSAFDLNEHVSMLATRAVEASEFAL